MSPRARPAPTKATPRQRQSPTGKSAARKSTATAAPEPEPVPEPAGGDAPRTVAGQVVTAQRAVANMPQAPFKYQELDLADGSTVLECLDCGTIANNRSAIMIHRRDIHGIAMGGRKRAANGAGLPQHLAAMSVADLLNMAESYNGLGDYIERLQTERDTLRNKLGAVEGRYRRLVSSLRKAGLTLKLEDE